MFVPDEGKVREKMLYASSRDALKRDLGGSLPRILALWCSVLTQVVRLLVLQGRDACVRHGGGLVRAVPAAGSNPPLVPRGCSMHDPDAGFAAARCWFQTRTD